jgi:hypothetical protein
MVKENNSIEKMKNIIQYYKHCINMIDTRLDMMLDKIVKTELIDKNLLLNKVDSIREFIRNDIKSY